jgi:hypothetical protein
VAAGAERDRQKAAALTAVPFHHRSFWIDKHTVRLSVEPSADRLFDPQRTVGLARDPERACPGLDPGWEPVFEKDHAQTKTWSGMMTRREIIPL